jgi:Ni,Fe-hydrogenase I large subunit
VNTPAPIKVDLSMDVNVYQHGIVEKKEAEAAADFRTAMDNRRNRMSEIQELKNNRLVGEGRSGLLSIRNRPAGEYGDYVEKTIEAENLDREALMRHEASEKSVDLAKVREEQWHHWQRKSFPGEWIEVANDDGTTYRWEQKQGAAED